MANKEQKEFTPALTLGFLTRWYDFLTNLFGLKERYYQEIVSHFKPKEGALVLDLGTGTANLG